MGARNFAWVVGMFGGKRNRTAGFGSPTTRSYGPYRRWED